MTVSSNVTVYVVQQLTWQYNDNWHELVDDEPVKAFSSREAADAYRLELERQRWEKINPHDFAGGLGRASNFSWEEIMIRLHEMGLPAPSSDYQYPERAGLWWSRCRALAGEDRLEQLMSIFDRLRFYEVVEVEMSF